METFFNTIYYYTNGLYSPELDTYLYETVPGYLHLGLFTLVCSLIVSAIFYYLLEPVRKQTFLWFTFAAINALLSFIVALWYTMTPLVNNEIDSSIEWSGLDSIMCAISNIIWSFIFFTVWSFAIKWKSAAKYVPFQKF